MVKRCFKVKNQVPERLIASGLLFLSPFEEELGNVDYVVLKVSFFMFEIRRTNNFTRICFDVYS